MQNILWVRKNISDIKVEYKNLHTNTIDIIDYKKLKQTSLNMIEYNKMPHATFS